MKYGHMKANIVLHHNYQGGPSYENFSCTKVWVNAAQSLENNGFKSAYCRYFPYTIITNFHQRLSYINM